MRNRSEKGPVQCPHGLPLLLIWDCFYHAFHILKFLSSCTMDGRLLLALFLNALFLNALFLSALSQCALSAFGPTSSHALS